MIEIGTVGDALDNYIIEQNKARNKKSNPKRLSASMLPYCLRKYYFSLKNPREFDLKTLKRFKSGDLAHEFIQKKVLNLPDTMMERSVIIPVSLKEQVVIAGRFDIILDSGEIVDIKKTAGLSYMKEAKKEHIQQLQVYMTAMQSKEGILYYVDLNSLMWKEYRIEYDHKIVEDAIERAKTLYNCCENNILPDKEETWICKKGPCEYLEECKNASKKDKET